MAQHPPRGAFDEFLIGSSFFTLFEPYFFPFRWLKMEVRHRTALRSGFARLSAAYVNRARCN